MMSAERAEMVRWPNCFGPDTTGHPWVFFHVSTSLPVGLSAVGTADADSAMTSWHAHLHLRLRLTRRVPTSTSSPTPIYQTIPSHPTLI